MALEYQLGQKFPSISGCGLSRGVGLMKETALHIFVISLFMLAGSMSAEVAASEAIDCDQSWTIDSKVMGEERTVLVSTPDSYGTGDARYPVLYVTDGRGPFKNVSAIAEFLARAGRMPEMIVVGVPNTDRNRDLTPTQAAMTRPDGSRLEKPSGRSI